MARRRGGSMIRELKSIVGKDLKDAKIKRMEESTGITGHQLKSRSFGPGVQQNESINTRRWLYKYNGDDSQILHAQKCFKNNLNKGYSSSGSYAGCGLGYSWTGGPARRKGKHYRKGISFKSTFAEKSGYGGGETWRRSRS
jgi:hypothetical protein